MEIVRVETFADGDTRAVCRACDVEGPEDCGHDGEDTNPACPSCQAALRQSALDAGIPASVIDGKSKLKDHFSPEYIESKVNPKGDRS